MIAPFVDLAWLDAHPEAVIADVRFYLDGRSPRDAYDAGHLPGAVFIDLHHALAGPADATTGRHPLPEPAAFAAAMAEAGISDGDTVIAYDDDSGVIAARLVWMLRVLGHEAAVLDGGLAAWPAGELETAEAGRPAATFTAAPWPAERLASVDEARSAANLVLDARPYARFLGGPDAVDPRFGHIPGARSLPVREHTGEDGRLLPVDQLRERFTELGAGEGKPVVSYCGSGVTACHNLLTLEHVGLPQGRLYPGSWSQYSATDLPLETGDPAARR